MRTFSNFEVWKCENFNFLKFDCAKCTFDEFFAFNICLTLNFSHFQTFKIMQNAAFCPLRNCQIDIYNVSKSGFEPLSDLKRSHYSNLFNFEALKVSFSVSVALCSRNFQNVKLRLDFVEMWSFYRHSNFMWKPILAFLNGPKMSFLAILETLKFEFLVLSICQVPNLPKFKLQSL